MLRIEMNSNNLVLGKTRVGKSYSAAIPIIRQMNASYVVTDPFRSVCQGGSAEKAKKLGCVQIAADKAVDFVAHGFPAGGAEMERHLVDGVADFLHQGGRRRVRGGWSVAALRHGQGDGLALSAGAVAHLRGGDSAGDRHAGVVGHRLSFHRSSKFAQRGRQNGGHVG